jgi:hypothetical protein
VPRQVQPASPRVILGLAVAVLFLCLAAPRAHASFIANAQDPAGDAASPDLDLRAFGLGYDRGTGELAAAAALAGAPGDVPATLVLVAGMRSPGGCLGGPMIGFGSWLDSSSAGWQRLDASGAVTAKGEANKRGRGDAIQEFSVTDRRLAGLRPECVLAQLVDPDNPANIYDTAGPVDLVARPELAVRLRGVPERVRTGRTYRLKVALSNPGDAPTGRVRVTLRRARGLTAEPRSATVRSIGPGQRRTARIKVRLSARADTGTVLEVRATAGQMDLTAEKRVYVRKPDRPAGGGGGEGGGIPRVCTRFFPDFSGESGGSLGLVPCTT